jgi:hypothetical protein
MLGNSCVAERLAASQDGLGSMQLNASVLSFLKQNVSETRTVSCSRCKRGEIPTQLSPLERASLNHWTQKKFRSRMYMYIALPFRSILLPYRSNCTQSSSPSTQNFSDSRRLRDFYLNRATQKNTHSSNQSSKEPPNSTSAPPAF